MIELKITADYADDLYATLHELVGQSVCTTTTTPVSVGKSESVKQATGPASDGAATYAQGNPVSDGNGLTATTDVSPSDDGEVDTGGWAWSPDLHASTRGKTKDGYWRMKVGVTRPADKPGFPSNEGSIYTESTGETESSPSTDAAEPTAESSDDDEFAAFREAAAKADAVDAAAKAAVPARKWTDADLGALCNQAAVKLGDPAPIKALITEFVAEGEVAHSRNIAEDRRAEFAAAVEAKAGITFAG